MSNKLDVAIELLEGTTLHTRSDQVSLSVEVARLVYCAVKAAKQENADLRDRVAQLEEALAFYAGRKHFNVADEDAWDTVSDEPPNFWCDEAGTATVEDGSVAKHYLSTLPSDYRRQLVDETIEKVAIATWTLKLNQMERHAIRDAIRNMKGTL